VLNSGAYDGTIIPVDRCKEPALSAKGEVIDLWYSGKAHAHGGNIQAVLAPSGFPVWILQAEPGSVHDITAARRHALPVLYPVAAAGLPTLADPGYDGAGIHIPVRQPAGRRELDIGTRTRNALLRPLRCLGERGFALLTGPLAHSPAHHRQPQQDRRYRPRRARPHPFRTRLHQMKIAEIMAPLATTGTDGPRGDRRCRRLGSWRADRRDHIPAAAKDKRDPQLVDEAGADKR